MNIKTELQNALNIAILKKNVMHQVADDRSKTAFGYYVIIAAAILGAVGQQLFPIFFKPAFTASLVMAVVQVISAVIGIYILSFIAKSIFKGQARHDQFFRVMAYGMVVMWISVIPQLSIISGVWGLVLMFVILTTIHKLSAGGAIGTILVSILVGFIISMILSPIYALIGLGGMGGYGSGSFMDTRDEGFKFDVKTEEGVGTVEFGEGGMRITGEEGEVFEINIPDIE